MKKLSAMFNSIRFAKLDPHHEKAGPFSTDDEEHYVVSTKEYMQQLQHQKKRAMQEMKDDPCWKGYEMVGTKDKNGKKVPNCVPVKEEKHSVLFKTNKSEPKISVAHYDSKETAHKFLDSVKSKGGNGIVKTVKEAKEKTEYDYEGDMARGQLQSIINNAQRVHDMLEDNDNLPEWVQSKITLAEDYISTVSNYLMSEVDESVEESASSRLMTMMKSKQLIKNPPKIPTPQERKAEQEKDKKPVSESDAAYGASLRAKEEKRKMSNISGADKSKLSSIVSMLSREKKKQPQGSDFAAQRRKERLSSNGRMDEEIAGWIAHFNGQKHEIKKHEAKDLWDAKQKAIAHFKAPKSKHGLIAIKPAYNEAVVISHKAPIGTRVADIGPGNKEYNVKTDKNYDSLSSLLKHRDKLPKKPKDEYDRKVEKYLKKKYNKEEVEQIEEGRPSQRHPLEGHEYHKKSDEALIHIAKDAHAAAEAMKSHNTDAENKYRDQANDSATVRHFRKTSGMPTWYKKKYGHMKEDVQIDEAEGSWSKDTGWKKDDPKIPFDGPHGKIDKSGAVHSPMSRVKHIAKQAMKKQMKEDSEIDVERTNTPAKRTVSKTTMMVKDVAKKSRDQKASKDKFEPEPELSTQIIRNNF